jgi:hypothetical protein
MLKKPSTKKILSQTAQNHVITLAARSNRGPAFLQHEVRPMSVIAPRRRRGLAFLPNSEDNIQKYARSFMRRMNYPEFYTARMDI